MVYMHTASPNVSVLKTDQLRCMGQDGNRAQYLLEWIPPDNIMDFDLAHYEVIIMTPNVNKSLLCINNTAIVSFNRTISGVQSVVNVSIVAVTQCGQRGAAMESPIQLGVCQSPVSSAINLKLSSLWAMLLVAGSYFNYAL